MNHNTLDARVHLQEKVWSRVVFVQIVVGIQHGMHFSSTAMLIQILFFFILFLYMVQTITQMVSFWVIILKVNQQWY